MKKKAKKANRRANAPHVSATIGVVLQLPPDVARRYAEIGRLCNVPVETVMNIVIAGFVVANQRS